MMNSPKRQRDEHIRRLAALTYAKDRVLHGKTNIEIAKDRGVSTRTIERTLTWAEKAGVFLQLEDKLLAEIGPIAVEAIKTALLDGRDVPKGAIELLQGLNIIKRNHPVTTKDVKEADDLAAYINAQRLQAQLDQNTIEGTLADVRQPSGLLTDGRSTTGGADLIPGYSPELLGVGASDAGNPPQHDPGDPERVSEGDGARVEPEAAPVEGASGDEDRLPGDEGPGSDPRAGS